MSTSSKKSKETTAFRGTWHCSLSLLDEIHERNPDLGILLVQQYAEEVQNVHSMMSNEFPVQQNIAVINYNAEYDSWWTAGDLEILGKFMRIDNKTKISVKFMNNSDTRLLPAFKVEVGHCYGHSSWALPEIEPKKFETKIHEFATTGRVNNQFLMNGIKFAIESAQPAAYFTKWIPMNFFLSEFGELGWANFAEKWCKLTSNGGTKIKEKFEGVPFNRAIGLIDRMFEHRVFTTACHRGKDIVYVWQSCRVHNDDYVLIKWKFKVSGETELIVGSADARTAIVLFDSLESLEIP